MPGRRFASQRETRAAKSLKSASNRPFGDPISHRLRSFFLRMSKFGMRLFASVLAGLGLALAGCMTNADGTRYEAPYRRVDQESPAFKAAVETATAAEQANGKSAKEAERTAVRRVAREFVAKEKLSREEEVAPLVAALVDLERPRGCWAYTLTTTQVEDGRTTVMIERFNPFEPEERLWTLVSDDGRPPTEKAQSDYRRKRLRKWKKQQEQSAKRPPESKQAGVSALYSQIAVSAAPDSGVLTFAFEREPMHIRAMGFPLDLPRSRETYVLNPTGKDVLRHTTINFGALTMTGIRIDAFEQATDYQIVETGLAPFPAKTFVRYHIHFFGEDLGDASTESVYSDYVRVKCYDDRFSVQLGELNVIDFLSDRK
jgi:hypothetical protein